MTTTLTDYFDPARSHYINGSALTAFDRRPADAKAMLDGAAPIEPSDAMQLGSLVHCLLLEPDTYERRYIAYDGRFDARSKDYQAVQAEAEGREIVKLATVAKATEMVTSCLRIPAITGLLAMAAKEVPVYTRMEGLPVKCKPDIWHPAMGWLVNLKTTSGSLEPLAFAGHCLEYNYLRDAAWYAAVMRAAGMEVRVNAILAVQSVAPYEAQLFTLSDIHIEVGTSGGQLYGREVRGWQRLFAGIQECISTGIWPGYEYWHGGKAGVIELPLPKGLSF